MGCTSPSLERRVRSKLALTLRKDIFVGLRLLMNDVLVILLLVRIFPSTYGINKESVSKLKRCNPKT